MPSRVRAISQKRPGGDQHADADDRQPEGRIDDPARQRHGAGQDRRQREVERKGAEEPARAFGKDEDQREGRQHLVEMVAVIEPPDHHDLHQRAECGRGRKARGEAKPERPRCRGDGGAGEGADHVERAMREVDQPHDAEDQRQPGRHQEQHHAELQAVEDLLGQKHHWIRSPTVGPGRLPRPGPITSCTRRRRRRRDPRARRRRSCWCRRRPP